MIPSQSLPSQQVSSTTQQLQPPVPFWKKYFNLLFSIFVLIMISIPMLVFLQKTKNSPSQQNQHVPETMYHLTPTGNSLTPQTFASTIDTTNQTIQTSLSLANAELTLLSQINASQDAIIFPANTKDTNVTNLKQQAADIITQRITTLNQLNTYIDQAPILNQATELVTSSQLTVAKKLITTPIEHTLPTLENLKAKVLTLDTTSSQIQSDIQSLGQLKVYANIAPKVHAQIALDIMQSLSQQVNNTSNLLRAYIRSTVTTAKELNTMIITGNTISKQLLLVNEHLAADTKLLDSISTSSDNASKNLSDFKTDIQSLGTNFQIIQTQLQNIKENLQNPNQPSTATSSATQPK